jgi:hypothetical protein
MSRIWGVESYGDRANVDLQIGRVILADAFDGFLLCHPTNCIVSKKLEDLDLNANLRLTWLRHNDSALLKEFAAITRQVASKH